jgi:hypothetical protein
MIFSDFKCGACGYITRKWELRKTLKCPVFQCMKRDGTDVTVSINDKKTIVRVGFEMEFLGSFKETPKTECIKIV